MLFLQLLIGIKNLPRIIKFISNPSSIIITNGAWLIPLAKTSLADNHHKKGFLHIKLSKERERKINYKKEEKIEFCIIQPTHSKHININHLK